MDRSRAKFPRANWPVPPIRTLRGAAERVAMPSSAWAAPVRSGLINDALPDAVVVAEAAPDLFAGLEVRTEPAPVLDPLPLADWTAAEDEPVLEAEIVSEHAEAEIILNDEVFWIDDLEPVVDPEAPIEGLTPLGAVAAPVPEAHVPDAPLDGLTAIGDVDAPDAPLQASEAPVEGLTATGDTVTPPAADRPDAEIEVEGLKTIGTIGEGAVDPPVAAAPVEGLAPIGDVGIPVLDTGSAGDLPDPWEVPASVPEADALAEPEAMEESAATEWAALGQPLTESLAVPHTDLGAAGEPDVTGDAGDDDAHGADPMELASRLERLADQIRMHGSEALEAAQAGGDSVEAALARALAGLVDRERR